MIEFKDITLADKDLIQSFTLGSLRRNCDLSFANLCSWIFLYQTKYAVMDNYLLLRFYAGEELAYMMPVGTGDVKPVLEALIKDAEEMGGKIAYAGGMRGDESGYRGGDARTFSLLQKTGITLIISTCVLTWQP